MIDFVVPDLFGSSGGIARIARAMTLALSRWAELRDATLTVHALMDQPGRLQERYLPLPHIYHAYEGQRARLAQRVLGRTWRGNMRAVVFAHPHLSVMSLGYPPFVKTAVVAHGVDVWAPLRLERRIALRRADALWPVSEDTARRLREVQGIDGRAIRVLPNGLDPFWPDDTTSTADGYLLAVGRLQPESPTKGIDLVIEALARLPDRPPLVIAGDGPDRARLEALAARLGVEARFAGPIGDAALFELYRGARAFVLPSSREGFGLVYLEAMSFGLPCVAANAGGAPEVVRDGETGVIVPPGDVDAVAAAIRRVLGPEGAVMGAAGRARVEREFLYPAYEARVHAAIDLLVS